MPLENLRKQLSTLPGARLNASFEKPVSRLSLSSFDDDEEKFRIGNSTPAVAQGPGTIGTIKKGLSLLNPMQKTEVRPLFARADQTVETYGGPLVTVPLAIAARTIEAIPSIALTTLANFRLASQTAKGQTSEGRVNVPFDVSRLGITDEVGQKFVQDSGAKMVARFDQYEKSNPGRTKTNIALASLSPVIDALDSVATGELLSSFARAGLKATRYSPELDKALQQYGMKEYRGDDFFGEFKTRFEKKASELIQKDDIEGLNELGRATNVIVANASGRGVPALNRFGQTIQDVSRLALQDSKYGFRLKNPMFPELAPERATGALPGYVVEDATPIPAGLSIRRVRRVGGAGEQASGGPYFRSKADQSFEPVDEKNVMSVPIRQDLDTFVAKSDEGFSVIEGRTGQQIGETEKTIAAAISSAKKSLESMPKEQLTRILDEAPLSPRYEQVMDEAPKAASGPLEGVDLKRTEKIPEADIEPLADRAVQRYFDEVISPRISANKSAVIGADDLKDYFGKDYNDLNHPIYSRAAFKIYEDALKRSAGDTVILTGGGPGAGKTETLVKNLEGNFEGVLYDSNMANKEGVSKQIRMARESGKNVKVYGLIPNLGRTRVHTILREKKVGRGISDKTFARGHAGFPKVLKELLEEGILKPNEVFLYDFRNVDTLAEASARVLSGRFEKDPLALLNKVQYNEEELAKNYAKEKYSREIRRSNDKPASTEKHRQVSRVDRPDQGSINRRGDRSNVQQDQSRARKQEPIAQTPKTEEESFQVLEEQTKGSEFFLNASAREEERITNNLRQVFADLKGVDISDLKTKFTDEDLEIAREQYKNAMDTLLDHPGRALVKFISKKEGQFVEIKDPRLAKTNAERARLQERRERLTKAAETAFQGTPMSRDFDNPDTIRQAIDDYQALRKKVREIQMDFSRISKEIRNAKQLNKFVESKKNALAREAARNVRALSSLAETASRSGYERGLAAGRKQYDEFVKKLKDRRGRLAALQEVYDLTDAEFFNITKNKDPRFMSDDEFTRFLSGVEVAAEKIMARQSERVLIDALISEKGLKNVDNLRKALQFPDMKNMSLDQLKTFGDLLAKTAPGDTFIGPRMIQTMKNTELGDVKTMGEARAAVAKKLGMDPKLVKEDADADVFMDRFLRDPAWADKDPLRKMIVLDYTAADIARRNKMAVLREEIEKLANFSRRSRRKKGGLLGTFREKILGRLAPTDDMVVRYMETQPEDLADLERYMTPQEIQFGKFGRELMQKYYQYALNDANQRWTLSGIRNSRFKDMYLPHMGPKFFERWKENGFVRAIGNIFGDVQESKVDFNAYGDKGEVLGYEKFFKNNLKRETEGKAYSKNVAAVLMSYADAFEKKILLDSQIPKIKMLEQLLGRKYRTPKTITNPEGTEKVSSDLTRVLNEWINNKKGQKIETLGIRQGSQAEKFLQVGNVLISLLDLGGNLTTQTASIIGNQLANIMSYARKGGGGMGGAVKGYGRALTKQGRNIARQNSGVIGLPPWSELANAFNEAGQTLMGSLFYIFSDLAYRSRRQLFLGLLTKEEFKSGIVSPRRLAEIKLKIGQVHAMPEFRSVQGNTALSQFANKYTEWAVPAFQTSMQTLGKVIKDAKAARAKGGIEGLKDFMKSHAYRDAALTALIGIGAYAVGQIALQPENSDTPLDKWRAKAAREMASIIQSMSGVGVFTSMRSMDMINKLQDVAKLALSLERYKADGPGYEKGDLKFPAAVGRLVTPAAVKNLLPASASGSSGGSSGRSRSTRPRRSAPARSRPRRQSR